MAAHAGPDSLENGLVLHLDAANSKSYPGSGTAWNTLVPGSNATLVNSPVFSYDQNGSFNFDGLNDTAFVTDSSYAGATPSIFSIEMIHKGTPPTLMSRSTGGWSLRPTIFTLLLINDYTITYTFDANQIYHQCVVVDNILLTRYINRSVANTVALSSSRSTCTNNKMYVSTILNSDGSIRSYESSTLYLLKIYNRALSQAEVTQNFNSLRGRYGI